MPMVGLLPTTEAVLLTSITPPQIDPVETTMTEKETESTWTRETIKVEEDMITMRSRVGAATSPERVEVATTVI